MKPFRRRIYASPRALLRDLASLLRGWRQIRDVMRGETLTAAFRERLMLAVTTVNGCRYCSYEHTRQALAQGIPAAEIEVLCKGIVDYCPAQEHSALLYAQHWAEMDAAPDPAVRQWVVDVYGSALVAEIEIVLEVIRFGNLAGNSLDYLLYRASFGRWGSPELRETCHPESASG